MTEIIDDQVDITINALFGEKAKIENIQKPDSIKINTSFDITYEVHNIGDTIGNMFGRLIDKDTEEIISGSEWTEEINPEGFKAVIQNFPDGISKNLNLTLTVGHNAD